MANGVAGLIGVAVSVGFGVLLQDGVQLCAEGKASKVGRLFTIDDVVGVIATGASHHHQCVCIACP